MKSMSNEITDLLIIALQEVHKTTKNVERSVELLSGQNDCRFNDKLEACIEHALVLSLGGTNSTWHFLSNSFEDPFYKFAEGKISADKLIKEVQGAIDNKYEGEIDSKAD
ncbi:MAG: hypothetical protein K0Q87_174 [Neobacillus sp.]|jgi:hypothetical protein|nr:hypothetical protein [Neobacillus sp.]